jgi:hypothetical protein
MGERLIISPEVRDVIRQGRIDERAFHAQDRIDIPCGIQGEESRAEGIRRSISHSNGGLSAEKIEQQYNGGASVVDRIDKIEF